MIIIDFWSIVSFDWFRGFLGGGSGSSYGDIFIEEMRREMEIQQFEEQKFQFQAQDLVR